MYWILGIAVGFLIGLIVGEATEDKSYKIAAGIVFALFSGAVGTFVLNFPTMGNAIGIGLFVGFIASIWYEPLKKKS
nr:hypothetical protein GZ18C8_71 [uncultured archaeon GZfos18C8]